MVIVNTLFKRFKELSSSAEKARETPTNEETTPTTKSTLAETVLQIQKMERKRPQP